MCAKLPPIVPGLFDRHSINIIVGNSFSGKTHLALNQLNDYIEGRGFLGYGIDEITGQALVPPVQLAQINCLQSYDQAFHAADCFSSLKDQQKFPIEQLEIEDDASDGMKTGMIALEEAFQRLLKRLPQGSPPELLYLEDIQSVLNGDRATDQNKTRKLFILLNKFCLRHSITIVATAITPKPTKVETNYLRVTDRIYGAVTWGQVSRTLIGIEYTDLTPRPDTNKPTSERRIKIQTRDALERTLYADFDEDGILKLVQKPRVDEAAQNNDKLDAMLELVPAGEIFTRAQFLEWGATLEISESSVDRWIRARSLPEMGFIEKVGQGKNVLYKKPQVQ